MNTKANHSQGLLLFRLGATQTFAIGTLKVKELTPYTPLTRLPHSHPAVLGAANIRDNTIPVIDMAAAVGYKAMTQEELQNGYIITTDCQRQEIGFMVRGIDKIVECNWRDISAPPKGLKDDTFLTGVTRVEEQLVQLIDVELILSKIFPDQGTHVAVLTDVQREQLKPLSILLVDDSLVARKQLSDALNGMNIPFQVTGDGTQALEIMIKDANSGSPVDLLVSDIEMPGLDGYELAFEVRDKPDLAATYIVLHSSISSEISISQAHQVGANEALTKFDAHELIQAMLRGAEHQQSQAGQKK
jgi:two-component system chemotaxis response regulator CheV